MLLWHLLLFSLTALSKPLQDIVTWDNNAISVRGERILFFSGEFHPFRLPSPGLWLDVFQKIRAMGYSGVSFYVYWALLEGEPGHVRSDGVFALDEFFAAASEAGIYLLARPGPYINSEVSGGGFPGWVQRIPGDVRTMNPAFLNATEKYAATIGEVVRKAQITEGGPVILFQPENEYSVCQGAKSEEPGELNFCLDGEYMAYVEKQFRDAGIVVPFINNDAEVLGNWAPGSGAGAVDLYSFDDYPFGWGDGCANPANWTRITDPLTQYNYTMLNNISSTSPFGITEYQGGAPDPWGGVGVNTCAEMVSDIFARVFYKMNYSFRITIFNLYMMFGGTNWGNIGYSSGYTSYDVGAAITEDRRLDRERYSELKLQANFLQVSPAYITSTPLDATIGGYVNTSALTTTRLKDTQTSFYVVRHTDYTVLQSTAYTWSVNTSIGNITVPQLGGSLRLNGRDSKIHVTDYDVGGVNLIYSSAEVFTWKKSGSRSVLLLYGGGDETHELAIHSTSSHTIEGDGVNVKQKNGSTFVQWDVEPSRRAVHFDDLSVYLLWRNDAYNHWVMDLPAPEPLGLHVSPSRVNSSVIVKGGYLLRNASITGDSLNLIGDINATTTIEVLFSPKNCSTLIFNGKKVNTTRSNGRLHGVVEYTKPKITLPDLSTAEWKYTDSLPEIQSGYDDSKWINCNKTTSNNGRNLTTPVSLYSSDYGYHSGSILYRGHFTATGSEDSLYLSTQGGFAYGHSVWLNSTFLGSWAGSPGVQNYNQTLSVSDLKNGEEYILTVLVDNLGYDLNFRLNVNTMKSPRGIMDYNLSGHEKNDIRWKITGNLGGEQYLDHSRGPLNEGSLFAERQGFHLPGGLNDKWEKKSLKDGLSTAGVGFFATEFELQYPDGYDIPTSLVFTNSTAVDRYTAGEFRIQFFVNGWQFGKYINNIGPQTEYPIPEGILNHHGTNYLALTLWALDGKGAKLDGIQLKNSAIIQSGYKKPEIVVGSEYTARVYSY
ncbi:hypothetical protein MW887_011508 [Aspergillus wentii]|nr:hypothetical protein MW887_011508 [Aspergillus wentii]